jgi:ABC-type polysaccharide/polyol phosphate export permease
MPTRIAFRIPRLLYSLVCTIIVDVNSSLFLCYIFIHYTDYIKICALTKP